MYAGFIAVLILGGAGAAALGTSLPGSTGALLTALGCAAFGAGLVLIGLQLKNATK